MVSVVTGNGGGLANSSKDVLGSAGQLGQAAMGRAAEQVTVNAGNGNLVVQGRDEYLVGIGADIELLRTYNSRGGWDGDNGDGWRIGYYRRLSGMKGAFNAESSTVRRTDADGHEAVYTYNKTFRKYVTTDGAGISDTLTFDTTSRAWTWTDGDTGATETYKSADGETTFRLTRVSGVEGHYVDIDYSGTLISKLSSFKAGASAADGIVHLNHDGSGLLRQIRSEYRDGTELKTRSLTRYDYDSSRRLEHVTTDLSPDDSAITDGATYTVSYGYTPEGRLRSIRQTDGSSFTIEYHPDGGADEGKVKSITDDRSRKTSFSYDEIAFKTTITDALSQTTTLKYDSGGQLREVSGATVGGGSFKQSYTYKNGDVSTSTNGNNETTHYEYSDTGALLRRTDAAGNVLARAYNGQGMLVSETSFSIADADGIGTAYQPGGARTTHCIYDTTQLAKRRLAYVVGPQGEVTHHVYNNEGQLQRRVQYTGAPFAGTPTFLDLEAWRSASAQAQTLDREVTEYDYDVRGQIKQERRFATASLSGGTVVNGGVSTTDYTYDSAGRLLFRQDASGVTMSCEYDGLNRVLKTRDAKGIQTIYAYGDADRKTSIKLDNGQTTVQIFDTNGRLVSSDVMGAGSTAGDPRWLGKTEYFYDALGRLCRTADATGVSTRSLYDVSGRKSADIAANGQLTEYLYDPAGRLVQTIAYATPLSSAALSGLTEASTVAGVRPAPAPLLDRITTRYYDRAGQLTGVVDADGYLTETQYDGTGAVTTEIRRANTVTAARLDVALGTTQAAPNRPAATPNAALDRQTRQLYDGSGRLAAKVDGDGGLTVWTHDTAGNVLSQLRRSALLTDAQRTGSTLDQLKALVPLADDEFTQWLYDVQGRQIAQVDAEGYLTEYSHDAAGRPQDTLRYLTRAFKPVVSGSPVTLRKFVRADLDALRPTLGSPLKTSRSYNSVGLLERETASDGTVTLHAYDNLQRLRSTTFAKDAPDQRTRLVDHDAWGRIKDTRTDGDATGVATTYDAGGRRTSTTDARGHTTYYYYDAQGRQVYAILRDPARGGEVTETLYSSFNEVQTTIMYSRRLDLADWQTASPGGVIAGGRSPDALVTRIASLCDTARDNRTTVVYNRRGLIQQAIDALGYKTDTTYTAFGDVDRVIVDTGTVIGGLKRLTTSHVYDRRGHVTDRLREDAGGSRLQEGYAFDALGRLSRSQGTQGVNSHYAYVRDAGTGRKVQVTNDFGGTTTTTYDALDRVVERTDRNGNTVRFVHDATNRKLTTTTAEGVQIVTEHTRHGQVYKITDGTGATTTYAYDSHGNLLTVTDALGNVTQSIYDANDNRRQVIQGLKSNGASAPTNDGSALTTSYSFDAANRVLTQTVDPLVGEVGLNLQTRYTYDGQGRCLEVTDPAGTVTKHKFTAKGELEETIVDVGGLNLKTTYRYDAQGRTLEMVRGADTAAATKTETTYDAFGRRLSQVLDPAGIKLKTSNEYNGLDQLILQRNSLNEVTERYRYDGLGRLEFSVDATGAVTRYIYDKEDRLTGSLKFSQRLASGWSSLDETALGSALAALAGSTGALYANIYDRDGRLVYTVDAMGGVTGMQYDGAGRVLVRRRYASSVVVGSAPDTLSGLRAKLVRDDLNDQVTRYVHDAAGNQRFMVDAQGNITENRFDRLGRVVETVQYATPEPPQEYFEKAATSRDNWYRYTSPIHGGSIDTVFDADRNANVIALSGTGTNSGYRLALNPTHEDWQAAGTLISWDMKFAEAFRIYVSITTSKGHRYLEYQPGTSPATGGGEYVQHFLPGAANGQWQRITRDLRADLAATQPDVEILCINALLVRGPGRIGDVALTRPDAPPTLTGIQSRIKTAPEDRTTRTVYDAAGRQRFTVDAEGYVTETRYDVAASTTTTLRYAKRISGATPYTPSSATPTLGSFTAGAIAALGSATTLKTGFDRAGRLATQTDGQNVVTRTTYDEAGRVQSEIVAEGLPEQSTTRYSYDSAGQRTAVTRAYGTALASTTRFEFDTLGRLWKTIDARGVALAEGTGAWERRERERLGYAADLATLSADARAAAQAALRSRYTTETRYDAVGRVKTLTQVVSATSDTASTPLTTLTTTTHYDAFGNAIQVTDPRGHHRFQVFDKLGRLVQAIDAERYLTAHRYDAFGNLVSSLRLDARVQGEITAGQAVAVLATAPASGTYALTNAAFDDLTTREYDRNNRLLRETDAENHAEGTTALDAFGQRKTVTNKLDASVSYTYDRLGRLLTETLPVQARDAAGQLKDVINEYEYDSRGNRTLSIEAKGLVGQRITKMRYDGANRLTLRIGTAYEAVAADGSKQTVTPADWLRYDARGNLIDQVSHGQLQADDVTVTVGMRSVAYYNALDQKTLEISADRVASRFAYDAVGQQVSQTVYATRILDATVINPGGSEPAITTDPANDRTLRTRYDEAGRKVETVLDNLYAWSSGDGSATDFIISEVVVRPTVLQQLFYDAAGNLTERKDGRGNSSFEYFDGNGRRTLSIDAGGAAIAWEYGRSGMVATKETRYAAMLSSGYAPQSTTLAGLAASNDPVQLTATIAANSLPAGEQNRITEFSLDRLGRVTEKRLLAVSQDHIGADGKRSTGSHTAITQYQYNGLGAIQQTRQLASQIGAAQTWEETDIRYDGLNREIHREAPGYFDYLGALVRPTTDIEYDGLGNVNRRILRGTNTVTETDDRITINRYDDNGLLTETTDASGAITAYAYDSRGHLSRRVNKEVQRSDLTNKRDIVTSYDSDAAGRVIVEKRWEGDKAAAVETRKTRYNAFGEITAKGIGDGWEEFAHYSTLGKVIKTNAGDGAIKFYVYDANGNMTREIRGNGDVGVDLRGLTMEQAAAGKRLPTDTALLPLFARISVYDRRNLLIQTIDPQIDVLKNSVSMSALYGQRWVPDFQTTDPALNHAHILPNATASWTSGATPKLSIQFPGIRYTELLVFPSNSHYWESGYTATPEFDLSRLKGTGRHTLFYQARASGTSVSADNPALAKGRIDIIIDSAGNVTATPMPAGDVERANAYVKFAPEYNRPNQWTYYNINTIVDGVIVKSANYPAYYDPSFPNLNHAAVEVSQYRPATGYRDIYLDYGISGTLVNGTLRVRIWSDGTLQKIQNDADPTTLPIEFSVLGREFTQAKISFKNRRNGNTGYDFRTGSFIPGSGSNPARSSFIWDMKGMLAEGDELEYTLEAIGVQDESGKPIIQSGLITMSGGSPKVLKQVITLDTSSAVTIKRFQSFNAFGEVCEERDERVGDRMLAAINDDLKARGQAAQAALTAEQVAAARTTLRYNTQGQLIAKIEPQTFVTAANGYRYRARPETRYGYDLLGRHTTTLDANDRLSRSHHAAGSAGEDGAAATFDAAGGKEDVFNATGGGITRYARDIFGDVRRVTDALGGVVEQAFDNEGRLTTVTRKAVQRADAAGNLASIGDLIERYEYNQLGQRLRATNASSGLTTTDYDALGRIVKTVAADGAKTEYLYQLKQVSDNAILAMDGAVSNGSAATRSGGYIKTTRQADGRSLIDQVEYFGHATRHTDLSGAEFTYRFNSAGQLATQTSTIHTGQTVGKNVSYTYYANGYIQSQRDHALSTAADYAYDNAGNRIYEAYFTIDRVRLDAKGNPLRLNAFQNSTITYDELNRIVRVQDTSLYDIRYEFDAVGNRRLVDSLYRDGLAGLRDRQTYWYDYDALNRFVITKGRLSSTAGSPTDIHRFINARRGASLTDTSVRIEAGGLGTDGVLIGYDKLSRRTLAEYAYAGQFIREVYGYSSDGFLQTTKQNDVLKTTRVLDELGRTRRQLDLANNQETQSDYDAGNRLTQQRFFDGRDASKNYRLDFSYYNAVSGSGASDSAFSATGKGALAQTLLTPTATPSSTSSTTYQYEYWDSAVQSTISKQTSSSPAVGSQGLTTLYYDVNGHISSSYDSVGAIRTYYTTTATGLVLLRKRNYNGDFRHHNFYYADDRRVGDVSNTPDEIQRVSYAEQLAVKRGGSKRTYYSTAPSWQLIDREFWDGGRFGDSWVRADDWEPSSFEDAFGVSTADFDQNYEPINDNYPGAAASSYTVRMDGETLGSVAQALWGDRAMWYLIAEANGLSVNSALRAGQLLVIPNKVTNIHNNSGTWRPYNAGEAIGRTDPTQPTPPPPAKKGCGAVGNLIMVAVAVAATLATAGAMAPVAGQSIWAAGAAAISGGSGLIGIAAAAVGSAAGSIASQAVGLAIGQIDSFSWRAVGQAALGGAVTSGVGAGLDKLGYLKAAGGTQGAIRAAGRAAIGTGVNMALHNDWSWRNVMISAVSAGAGSAVGNAMNGQAWAQAGNGFGQRMASGLAASLTARSLTGGNRASYGTVFVSTLGNAIGESLASQSQSESPYALSGRGARLGGGNSAEGAVSTDEAGIGLGSFTARLGARGYERVDAALYEAKARIAQRAYAGGDSGGGGGESEVLPYSYLARDGSGHNTPQTAVLIEGRATRDWLELDDYDVLGNRTGFTTSISAAPTTMSYGDQMRNALWGTGHLAYGGVKGAVNGVPAFVVGTVKGYAYIGAGLRDGFDSLVGNRSGNYLDRAIQAGTPHTGEIWSYDNGLQRLGGYGGEMVSPAAYSAALRVGGRLGVAFIDGIVTEPMPGSRSAQRGAIFLGDGGKTFGRVGGQSGIAGETTATATGKQVHAQLAAERRASGDFDLVNQPIADARGNPISVPRRVDLSTGEPIGSRGTQVAKPDAVRGDVVIDDKPLGRHISKDSQEIIRFIKAYQESMGTLPRTIGIQRYDPATGRPVVTELYTPEDFFAWEPK